MKISQICAVFILMSALSVAVFAGSDPKIVIHGVNGGNGPNTCPQGCTNVGSTFTFDVPNSGSGTLYFTNESGQNWTALSLVESGEPAPDITCVQTLFLDCAVTGSGDTVEITMSGVKTNGPQPPNPHIGIPNGQSFSISFVCVGKDCWPGGLQFSGYANTNVSDPPPGTAH
jgi:hypothetical protein